jgi:hypothetical protein
LQQNLPTTDIRHSFDDLVGAGEQPGGQVWRIGFLSGAARSASLEANFSGGFLQGLQELGLRRRTIGRRDLSPSMSGLG